MAYWTPFTQGWTWVIDTVLIRKNGVDVGTRATLNVIEGTGIVLTVTDDAGDDEVEITIASHAQTHTIVSHDTTGTGANLNELTGGGATTLHSHTGGAVDIIETELDFGTAVAQQAKSFTITDAAVGATSSILMEQSLEAATGKQQDENEMDSFNVRCVAAAGSFTAYVESLYGSVAGIFKFNYLVG